MMQTAALRKNPNRIQDAITASVPAAVGGWNDKNSLAAMPMQDAVILDNYFPEPSKVILRYGYTNFATGLGVQVESVMGYKPQTGTRKLFAAAGSSIYDVTAGGAVGAAVVTPLSNARFQKINIATPGGNYLMAVNGADKLRGWDGTVWWADGDGSHDITGVDTSTCSNILLYKTRVWLIQPSSCSAWYLANNSIAGAASQLSFGSIFQRGGQLVAMADWTLDAGAGLDDYAAFISDQGEVAVYQGSDPSSVATWALVGVYWIGSPLGNRCTCQYAGDVLLISKDGLIPLSKALMSSRVNTSIALTDKIQNTVSNSTSLYASNFGWQVTQFPPENMIILNVPIATGQQQQYVMNTITGAWCRFKGWYANCFEFWNETLYFGGNGIVAQAWNSQADAGNNINGEALQAFNYFMQEAPANVQKEFTMARPLVAVDSNTGFVFGINTDFDMSAPTGVPTFISSTAGTWDSAKWDSGTWGGNPQIQKSWQTVNGIGYSAGLHIVSATNSGKIEWYGTDFAFRPGGVL